MSYGDSNFTIKATRREANEIAEALETQEHLLTGRYDILVVSAAKSKEIWDALSEEEKQDRMQRLGAVQNLRHRIG